MFTMNLLMFLLYHNELKKKREKRRKGESMIIHTFQINPFLLTFYNAISIFSLPKK